MGAGPRHNATFAEDCKNAEQAASEEPPSPACTGLKMLARITGNITGAAQVNTRVAAGMTDLAAPARPLLNGPQFVLNAAARYGYRKQYWLEQYAAGKFPAEADADRSKQEELELMSKAKPADPQAMLAVAVARGEVLSG